MKRLLVAALALCLAGPALAVAPQDPALVKGMISDLEDLQSQGQALKKDLDPADEAAIKACQAEHGGLHDQAVALRDRAARLPQLAYRINLTMAASAAADCVACGQGGDQCAAVAPALERVRDQMKTPAP